MTGRRCRRRHGAPRPLTKRNAGAIAAVSVVGLVSALVPGVAPGLHYVGAFGLAIVGVVVASRWFKEAVGFGVWAGGAVLAGTTIAVYLKPVAATRSFGSFGLIFVGTIGILLVGHLAGSVGARRAFRGTPPRPWLPHRAPIVGLFAVWIVMAFFFAEPTAHQARTLTTQSEPVTVPTAVTTWLDGQQPTGSKAPYLPMLFVGASGGGSKAAYWTDLVIDCLLGKGSPDETGECPNGPEAKTHYGRLFLTSSVSGGSVGIRHLLANATKLQDNRSWVDAAAGPEALSPVVGWGLFHDLPIFMLGLETDPRYCKPQSEFDCRLHADRALVQETAIAGGEDRALEQPRDHGVLGAQP